MYARGDMEKDRPAGLIGAAGGFTAEEEEEEEEKKALVSRGEG